jgi:hypothetical protein
MLYIVLFVTTIYCIIFIFCLIRAVQTSQSYLTTFRLSLSTTIFIFYLIIFYQIVHQQCLILSYYHLNIMSIHFLYFIKNNLAHFYHLSLEQILESVTILHHLHFDSLQNTAPQQFYLQLH